MSKTKVSKKLDEVRKSVRRTNDSIKRQNKWFASLKPAEKRVAIARDVLAQLRLGKLKATVGIWLGDTENARNGDAALLLADQAQKKQNMELQSILNNIESCDGCALGGLFMCAVKNADKLKVCDLLEFESLSKEEKDFGYEGTNVGVDQQDAFKYLRRFFSADQLAMIECAFERGGGHYNDDSDELLSAAKNFASAVDAPQDRMTVIMQNIIVNKGKFCSDQDVVPTWTAAGFVE